MKKISKKILIILCGSQYYFAFKFAPRTKKSGNPCTIAGVAKVRPAGHMRPSKDFLRPLRQILDTQLSYICKKNTQN